MLFSMVAEVHFLMYMQGGAVYIRDSGSKGTFENCNFTSNSAIRAAAYEGGVSLVVVL